MRSYASDAKSSAARVIAMTVLADGVPDASEMALLSRPDGLDSLGIRSVEFSRVMQSYCEDLQQSIGWFDSLQGELPSELIDALLAEVQDPDLQQRLFAIMLQVVTADGDLSEGEKKILARARSLWGRGGRWPIRIRTQQKPDLDLIH